MKRNDHWEGTISEAPTKKIYVITDGEYSDYNIVTVLSTKSKAEEFLEYYKKAMSCSEVRIEEYKLDEFMSQVSNKMLRYNVLMQRDGTVRNIRTTDPWGNWRPDVVFSIYLKEEYTSARISYGQLDKECNKYYTPMLDVVCFAKDEKHAVKIANEKRAMLIAQNYFPSDAEHINNIRNQHGMWLSVDSFIEIDGNTMNNKRREPS